MIAASILVQFRQSGYTAADWTTHRRRLLDAHNATPSYTTSATYRYNPTGGAITITRCAAGTYHVRFSGLISIAGTGGNVQVTPYGGGTTNRRVVSWNTSGADLLVNMRCNTTSGVAADSLYTVL